MLDSPAIGSIIGSPARAASYWPLFLQALQRRGLDSTAARVAVGANVAAESQLAPVFEAGSNFAAYEPGTRVGQILGNTTPGDGARYKGRGFLQLTGRDNYRRIGQAIGVNLEAFPDLLVTNPGISAEAAVAYLDGRGAFSAADRGDWQAVRRTVQPGSDPAGMARFLGYVNAMLAASDDGGALVSVPPIVPPDAGQINPKVVGLLVALLIALLGLRRFG